MLLAGLLPGPGAGSWLSRCAAAKAPRGRQPAVAAQAPLPRFTIAPYLQDVRTDGIVVRWETDVPVTGVVRLDLPGQRTAFLSPPGTMHEVRLSGLRPATRYRYVVAIRAVVPPPRGSAAAAAGAGVPPGFNVHSLQREVRSPSAEFVTAPTSGPFTFLVYGDNRDRDADHAQVIRAMIPEAPDFVIQTGDMVGNANEDHLWRRFFATASPILRSAPMYPALGNHELRGDPDASHFYRYFVVPGGEAGRPKVVYYSFRYSNSLFIALDGNSPYDAGQVLWLERTLQAASTDTGIRHVFVFVHQPPYAVGAYCGSERAQRRFVPLFQRYRVRAVFGGHEHAYQHLDRGGVRYFVSGGGGAPLYFRTQPCSPEDQRSLQLFAAVHHYLRVRVRGAEASLTAVDKTGKVLEQVQLHHPVPEPAAAIAAAEEAGPKRRFLPSAAPLLRAALALPLAVMAGVAVAAGVFGLLRRRRPRRRKDLLPGGEPPPSLHRRHRTPPPGAGQGAQP